MLPAAGGGASPGGEQVIDGAAHLGIRPGIRAGRRERESTRRDVEDELHPMLRMHPAQHPGGVVQLGGDLVGRVVMAVDVATDPRGPQEVDVVATGEQADVVHLRDAGHHQLDRPRQQEDADYVRVLPDEVAAGADAARLLVDSGNRRIHLIGVGDAPATAHPFGLAAAQRLRGALAVFAETGQQIVSARPTVQWLPPEGFRLVSEVLDSGAEVDALLRFNDCLAMGAYQALQERGVRVPDDVSVLSFDDTSFARWLRPGLTTFAFPQRALGRAAADELIDLIERGAATDGSSAPPAHLVPLPLRMRASVADRT